MHKRIIVDVGTNEGYKSIFDQKRKAMKNEYVAESCRNIYEKIVVPSRRHSIK